MSSITVAPELLAAFDDVQMPRSPFALENFVVGSKYTEEAQYAQIVLETQIKYDALRLAQLDLEKKDNEIARLQVEREQIQRAMLGAKREFDVLRQLWEQSPKFTREQLAAAAGTEHALRIQDQARQDVMAYGRPTPSALEGLRQIGMTFQELPDGSKPREISYMATVPQLPPSTKGDPR